MALGDGEEEEGRPRGTGGPLESGFDTGMRGFYLSGLSFETT